MGKQCFKRFGFSFLQGASVRLLKIDLLHDFVENTMVKALGDGNSDYEPFRIRFLA